MPRTKLVHDSRHLSNLKKQLELNYGSSVFNATDCDKLSNQIANGRYGNISGQTLRRLFGLVKCDFSPSLYTLNVLSRFCGFDDWSHFTRKSLNSEILLQDVINVCTAFFDIDMPVVDTNLFDNPFLFAVQNIAKLIYNDMALYKNIVPKLAPKKTAHEYFFQRFIVIDKLCCGFTNGYKLYLKHKKTDEATIFGNAILFLGAILEENLTLSSKYLLAINTVKAPESSKVHPYIIARGVGSNLLYCHFTGDLIRKEKWLETIDIMLLNNPNRFGYDKIGESCEFEYMICEYLLLAECYEKIKAIMVNIFKTFNGRSLIENKAKWHFVPCHRIYYKALIMTGDFTNAKTIQHVTGKEQDGQVFWCMKDYYSLHLLQCRLKLRSTIKTSRKNFLNQYEHLINSTRFIYFRRLMK